MHDMILGYQISEKNVERNARCTHIFKSFHLIWRFRLPLLWQFSKAEIIFEHTAREYSSALWITSKRNWGLIHEFTNDLKIFRTIKWINYTM